MPIRTQQNDEVKKLYYGTSSVQKVYQGTTLIYSAGVAAKVFYEGDSGYLSASEYITWSSPSYTSDDRPYIHIRGYESNGDIPAEASVADTNDLVYVQVDVDPGYVFFRVWFYMQEKRCTIHACYWYEGNEQDGYYESADSFAIEKVWTVIT